MKKICVTGLRGIPGVMGGVETHCEELLPRIAKLEDNIEIEVCCRAPYVDTAMTRFRNVTLSPLYSPTRSSFEAIVATLIGVLHARRHGADAVHIHAVGPALVAPLARMLGLRVLLTHHGADYNRGKWGRFARLMLRIGEQVGMRSANKVICVSPSLAEEMKQRYPSVADRVDFIPNGIATMAPPDRPAAETLAELGLEKDRFILCAARMVPEKELHTLIEAHRLSGDPRILAIAGGAPHGDRYATRITEMARACGPGRVRLLGRLPRSVLGTLYRNASLFVLPSSHEGLPIAALEALSCRCPVLLSDIQPNLDIGLPEANYFPVGNVEALARKLKVTPLTPAAPEADGTPLMNWDEVARRTARHYRQLLGTSASMRKLRHAG